MGKVKEQSKASKIINIVVIAIELIIIIAGIGLSIAVITGSKSTTKELGEGYNITVVLSPSMKGDVNNYDVKSFNPGDLAIIKSVDDEEKKSLKVGDVVTYLGYVQADWHLVTHRIVKINTLEDGTKEYLTRGDAENEGDELPYRAGDIQGKVVTVIPKLGWVINFFQKSTNFLLTVVLPLAALLIYNVAIFIRQLMQAKLKKVEEKNKADIEEIKKALLEANQEELRKQILEQIAQQSVKENKEEKIDTKETIEEKP